MKAFFEQLTDSEFDAYFGTTEACNKFLAECKWADGFTCRCCGHHNYCMGGTPYSRRCTRCKKTESATAHTMFHHCRIPLPVAFKISYMVCKNPKISSYEISECLSLRHMTCWKFKTKLLECIENNSPFTVRV